jgi:type I restriction enzyme S subunit
VTACQNGVWGEEPAGGSDDIPCVRVPDFDRSRFLVDESRELTVRAVTDSQRVGKVLRRGNLLLEKSGGGELQPVGAVVMYSSDRLAVCSNFIARMPVAEGYLPEFLRYLHAAMYTARVNTRSIKQNIGIQNLDSGSYLDELAGLPPLPEQQSITAFLDRETARIDALIERKERLIALLEEKRQAVISHAVTRGLDPTAPLKDSGVPWLGMVPSHWNVMAIGWLAAVCNGATPPQNREDYWQDGNIPWVASGEVNEGVVTSPTAYITKHALRDTSLQMIPKGSVLLGMIGQGKTRGLAAVLGIDACINQNVAAILPGPRLNGLYLRHALTHAYEPIRKIGRGGQQGALNCELIRSIRVAVPPIAEQERVVHFLNEEYRRTSELTNLLRRHNRMLAEYRTALISAAVTGQIDVRDEVTP